MRPSVYVLVFGSALLASGATLMLQRVMSPSPDAKKEQSGPTARRGAATPESRKVALRGPRAASLANSAAPEEAAARVERAAQPPQALTPKEPAAQVADQVRSFDTFLAGEARDGAWATEIESAVTAALKASAKELPGVAVDHVSCGTSLCRVELKGSGSEAESELPGLVVNSFPGTTAWFSQHESLGKGRTVLFMARPGRPIPRELIVPSA